MAAKATIVDGSVPHSSLGYRVSLRLKFPTTAIIFVALTSHCTLWHFGIGHPLSGAAEEFFDMSSAAVLTAMVTEDLVFSAVGVGQGFGRQSWNRSVLMGKVHRCDRTRFLSRTKCTKTLFFLSSYSYLMKGRYQPLAMTLTCKLSIVVETRHTDSVCVTQTGLL